MMVKRSRIDRLIADIRLHKGLINGLWRVNIGVGNKGLKNMEDIGTAEKDQAFIELSLTGMTADKAAKKAGFSNPSRDTQRVVSNAKTRKYVRSMMIGRLDVEGAPLAYALMIRVMNDPMAEIKLRIDIAKYLFAAAGYTPPKAAEPPKADDERAFSEMTSEELRQFIEKTEAELANRAFPAHVTLLAAPAIPQSIDDLM